MVAISESDIILLHVCIVYRIAGIFRGYECLWFSRIRHEPRTFITANLILHAWMLQKGAYSTKIKSAKTFLKAFPRKCIPLKYTRYMVSHGNACRLACLLYNLIHACIHVHVGVGKYAPMHLSS